MEPRDEITYLRACNREAMRERILRLQHWKEEAEAGKRLDGLREVDLKTLPGALQIFRDYGANLEELRARYPDDERLEGAIEQWRNEAQLLGLDV